MLCPEHASFAPAVRAKPTEEEPSIDEKNTAQLVRAYGRRRTSHGSKGCEAIVILRTGEVYVEIELSSAYTDTSDESYSCSDSFSGIDPRVTVSFSDGSTTSSATFSGSVYDYCNECGDGSGNIDFSDDSSFDSSLDLGCRDASASYMEVLIEDADNFGYTDCFTIQDSDWTTAGTTTVSTSSGSTLTYTKTVTTSQPSPTALPILAPTTAALVLAPTSAPSHWPTPAPTLADIACGESVTGSTTYSGDVVYYKFDPSSFATDYGETNATLNVTLSTCMSGTDYDTMVYRYASGD